MAAHFPLDVAVARIPRPLTRVRQPYEHRHRIIDVAMGWTDRWTPYAEWIREWLILPRHECPPIWVGFRDPSPAMRHVNLENYHLRLTAIHSQFFGYSRHRGRPPGATPAPESTILEACRMREGGAVLRVIAERFGVSIPAARQWIDRPDYYIERARAFAAWRETHGLPEDATK
jgi:hypothetical protein